MFFLESSGIFLATAHISVMATPTCATNLYINEQSKNMFLCTFFQERTIMGNSPIIVPLLKIKCATSKACKHKADVQFLPQRH